MSYFLLVVVASSCPLLLQFLEDLQVNFINSSCLCNSVYCCHQWRLLPVLGSSCCLKRTSSAVSHQNPCGKDLCLLEPRDGKQRDTFLTVSVYVGNGYRKAQFINNEKEGNN